MSTAAGDTNSSLGSKCRVWRVSPRRPVPKVPNIPRLSTTRGILQLSVIANIFRCFCLPLRLAPAPFVDLAGAMSTHTTGIERPLCFGFVLGTVARERARRPFLCLFVPAPFAGKRYRPRHASRHYILWHKNAPDRHGQGRDISEAVNNAGVMFTNRADRPASLRPRKAPPAEAQQFSFCR